MKRTIKSSLGWLGKKIRGHFIAGILVMIPLGLTIWIFKWIFDTLDGFLQPTVIEPVFGREIPGVGFGIIVVLVYIVGVIASNVLGRKLIRFGESLLERVPIVRQIYMGISQITQSFSAPRKTRFMQVVLIEFPRKGTRTIGFITNVESDGSGNRLYNVFVPTSPNPTSGFLQIVKEEEIVRTKISVDSALKMVVSGGRISPKEVQDKLFKVIKEEPIFDKGAVSEDTTPVEDVVLIREGSGNRGRSGKSKN